MVALFIQGLALARLLKLLTEEEGPWSIFEKIRAAVGIDKHGNFDENKMLAKLFDCYWCLGVWVGLAVFIVYKFVPSIVYILAIAMLGSLLNAVADRLMYE